MKTYSWASCLTCLAMALAAGGAYAQDDSDQRQYDQQRQSDEDQNRDTDQDKNDKDYNKAQNEQDRDQAEQDRPRAQQDRQRADQDRRRAEQDRQRGEQQRDRSRQFGGNEQWDEDRGFPRPNRDAYGRSRDDQWNRDQQQFGRDQQRGGQSGNDAGLGVSIIESDRDQGLEVVRVHRDSPAEQAGVREGDIITRVDGQQVQSTRQFISRIRNMNPGDRVELQVRRDGQQRSLQASLETRQEALVRQQRGSQRWQQDSWRQDRGSQQARFEDRGRGGNVDQQISQISRQIDDLSRELDQLRNALSDLRDQTRSGERTARFDEFRDSQQDRQRQYDGGRSYQYQDRGRDFGGGYGQRDQFGDQGRGYGSSWDQTPGGEVGGSRLRPDRN